VQLKGLFLLLSLLSVTGLAAAQDIEDFSATIDEFRRVSAVEPYFESAYGYAVWRRIARGGLGIGAATGRGQIYRNGEVTGFSRLVDISIGLQAGGQAYKQIIFFEDERAYNDFTSGNFQFDAAASAVAVTASAQARAGTQGAEASAGAGSASSTAAATTPGYQRGLQVFTMTTGGLMYQATIGGQKYNFTPVGEE
jgi:lipid-binding SYLF domain-containing protein